MAAVAEGWDPDSWREVADSMADLAHWIRPVIPAPGDPNPYTGTPVSG